MQRYIFLLLVAAFGLVGCIEAAPDAGSGPGNNGFINNMPTNNGVGNNGTDNNGVATNNVTVGPNNTCVPEPPETLVAPSDAECGIVMVSDGCAEVPLDLGNAACEGEPCLRNQCGCDCRIDAACFHINERNPENSCEVCTAENPDDWSLLADDAPCDDNNGCTPNSACDNGVCEGGVDCSALDDLASCETGKCDPTTDTCVPDLAPPGTVCGAIAKKCLDPDMECSALGVCEPVIKQNYCYVNDECFENGDRLGETCRSCMPSAGQTGFTSLVNGESCGDTAGCTRSYCDAAGMCDVDVNAYVEGDSCMDGLCMGYCVSSTTNYCDTSYYEMYMDMGTGTGTCEISGVGCVPHGMKNPANDCQLCDTTKRTMAWSNVTLAENCAGGTCDGQGLCVP